MSDVDHNATAERPAGAYDLLLTTTPGSERQPQMSNNEASSSQAAGSRKFPRLSIGSLLERMGLPILLLALVLFFAVHESTTVNFRSAANAQNIFANQSVTGLIALGMVIPLVAGYFDLSVAAIAGLASVTVAAVSGTHGQPVAVGIALALALAIIAGCINGVLVAILRLNAFITTFGTYVLLGGLLQFYTGGSSIGFGLPASFGQWGSQRFAGIAMPFWLLMVVAVALYYLLTQTPFGRKLTAIGSNEAAARLAGIRVDRAVFISFVLSALLGGIAGALLTSRTLVADSSSAQAYLFPALAAVFLGQTAIRPGQYNVWGTVIGVFLVAVAVNGLILMGANFWVTDVFNGTALVLSVALSTLIGVNRDRRARKAVLRSTREARVDTSESAAASH
jgi:ribose transport system permease protein